MLVVVGLVSFNCGKRAIERIAVQFCEKASTRISRGFGILAFHAHDTEFSLPQTYILFERGIKSIKRHDDCTRMKCND